MFSIRYDAAYLGFSYRTYAKSSTGYHLYVGFQLSSRQIIFEGTHVASDMELV